MKTDALVGGVASFFLLLICFAISKLKPLQQIKDTAQHTTWL